MPSAENVFVSDEIIDGLNRSPIRDSDYAHAIGITPSYLSKIKCRAVKIRPDDPRIHELGNRLGVPRDKLFLKAE